MDILTNRTVKTSNFYSRYNGFNYFYNKLDKTNQMSTSAWLKEDNTYESYTVKDGDTYDSIALEYYNNPTYYWIICDFNRVIDPFIKPEVGSTLYIPTRGKNLVYEVY